MATASESDPASGTFELNRVMTRTDRVVFVVLSGLLIVSLAVFFGYWSAVPEWSSQPLALVAMTVFLLLFIGQFLQSWSTLPAMRRPVPPEPEPDRRVALITTFVPGAESLAMLEKTVAAMAGVTYPHDCWVLDEGDDPEVKALCRRHEVRHFSRKGRPELNTDEGRLKARTKYGNVNSWLDEVGWETYDIVGAFDPDHVPFPDFLNRTLGYFRDPSVGFVQGAQVYYNQEAGFIARGAAEETYAYYSSTLMAGSGSGYTVMVGCHNVHRMTALKKVGGLAPHDADDLLTALHYSEAGWRGIYVPETLAVGLTPVDWESYLTQQRRWSRSVFDIKLRHLPRLRKSVPARPWTFAVFQGMAYVVEVALPVIGALILTWILVTGEASIVSRLFGHQFLVLLLVLAAVNVFRQRFYLEPERERGLHWRAGLLKAAKWPFVALGLFEAVTGRRRPYEITTKDGVPAGAVRFLVPHLVLAALVAGAYAFALTEDRVAHWSLHLWSPIVVGGALTIVATGYLRAPPAFEAGLLERAKASFGGRAEAPILRRGAPQA